MKKLLDIRIDNGEQYRETLLNYFTPIIEKAIELEIWDDSITKIIITDNIIRDVSIQVDNWKTNDKVNNQYTVCKVLFNYNVDNPEHYIFFQSNFWNKKTDNTSRLRYIFDFILSVSSKNIIPKELLKLQYTQQTLSVKRLITNSAIVWVKEVYIQNILSDIFEEKRKIQDHNLILTNFKKSLKRLLFGYNTDSINDNERHNLFVKDYSDILEDLIKSIIQNDTDKKEYSLKEEEECREVLYEIIDEVYDLENKTIDNGTFDITLLTDKINHFSKIFNICIGDNENGGIKIELSKNPKDYFKKELVDTEPRIVCFLDILGFSNIIEDYDTSYFSTSLQDLQESFVLTIETLLNNKSLSDTDTMKYLEYQTFSDNVCISVPFFNNERDFLHNFNIIVSFVRGFQEIMMTKGFFLRGGISTGSYFADDNMIFSKGLVNAYQLESKKAIYPRVIIDKNIVVRIQNISIESLKRNGLFKTLIIDWENKYFLNPINISISTLAQIEQSNNDAKSDLDKTDNLDKLIDQIQGLAFGLFKQNLPQEDIILPVINEFIDKNIELYQNNEHIQSKYLWLKELIKWIEDEKTSKIIFKYFFGTTS